MSSPKAKKALKIENSFKKKFQFSKNHVLTAEPCCKGLSTGNSPGVQWLGLCALAAEGLGQALRSSIITHTTQAPGEQPQFHSQPEGV